MPRTAGDIWDHYQVLNSVDGKKHVACIYCSTDYKMGTATRMKLHTAKCKSCPDEIRNRFAKPRRHVEIIREREGHVPFGTHELPPHPGPPTPGPPPAGPPPPGPPPTITSQTLPVYNASTSACSTCGFSGSLQPTVNIDASIARAIYASGVSLNLLESKYWKAVLEEANVHTPSRHSLSNSLLETEYTKVKSGMMNKINNSLALGLVSDGWTNVNGKGVVNFIVTTPEPIYYKSIYPEYRRETGEYLGDEMLKVIDEVGSEKFFAVITDNASNMKSAWRKVTTKYPHITCIGCASHTLNLLCNDIMKTQILRETLKTVSDVILEIKKKRINLATFEKIQTEKYGQNKCSLKLFSKTRWNCAVTTLESFKRNREALETLAISNTLDRLTRADILNEEVWEKVEDLLCILQPVADALTRLESDSAKLSDVPAAFSKLTSDIATALESVTVCSLQEKVNIKQVISKRKTQCIRPIHMAANLLDPRYRGRHIESGTPVATEFITNFASFVFRQNLEERQAKIIENLVHFKTKTGYYGISNSIWVGVNGISPNLWWRTFAAQETISPIAMRLLSLPPSSAASERNWSLFGSTHTETRNRLKDERLDKLVYIRSNLRFGDGPSATSEQEEPHEELNNSLHFSDDDSSMDSDLNMPYVENPIQFIDNMSQSDIDDLNNL